TQPDRPCSRAWSRSRSRRVASSAAEIPFTAASLGREPVQVAGEERRLADVLRAGEAGDPALEAEGEPAVRRHPELERLQIALERGRVAVERGDVVLVPVQPLAAGHDFEAAEEQVERVRVLGPAGLRMRV